MTVFDLIILMLYVRVLYETVHPSDSVLYLFNLWTLGFFSIVNKIRSSK